MIIRNKKTGNILTVTSKETIEIMLANSGSYESYTPAKSPTKEPAEEAPRKKSAKK